ncbi:hypothetical protein GUJ93_ZPchr0012g20946 [Zizania palustris]|uniref:Uncharacterized protein n=1 Tax=Zizania palustris TaxID=103762 RepID=A0A8J5WJC7_ZIZPA|nr:hypothetical protein GUJ93_ZPchr0012g20946 [Zizania palustris]
MSHALTRLQLSGFSAQAPTAQRHTVTATQPSARAEAPTADRQSAEAEPPRRRPPTASPPSRRGADRQSVEPSRRRPPTVGPLRRPGHGLTGDREGYRLAPASLQRAWTWCRPAVRRPRLSASTAPRSAPGSATPLSAVRLQGVRSAVYSTPLLLHPSP